MTEQALQQMVRTFRTDFPAFGSRALRIRTKTSEVVPFRLNPVQMKLHRIAEQQKRSMGRVRLIVLKGRQMGVSTYIQARFYHLTTLWQNVHALIMSHDTLSTQGMLQMARLFNENNPLRPTATGDSKDKLVFGDLNSQIHAVTAGAKSVGRSLTNKLFHGSEVALWENARDHFSGAIQTVSDAAGTEVVLESTSQGPYGQFFDQWGRAVSRSSLYIAVFLAWYEDPSYRFTPPPGFVLSSRPDSFGQSEIDYARRYGLDEGQMCWRREKIATLGEHDFRREYPAEPEEAFRLSGDSNFITSRDVIRAQNADLQPVGPVVMGVDPAGRGRDQFTVCVRQGRKILYLQSRSDVVTSPDGRKWMEDLKVQFRPGAIFIDCTGMGQPILDEVKHARDSDRALYTGVNFGAKSEASMRYKALANSSFALPYPINRRTEMWLRMAAMLSDPVGMDIPDKDTFLHRDLLSQQVETVSGGNTRLRSKKDLAGVSPDKGDAVALTFSTDGFIPDRERPRKPRGGFSQGSFLSAQATGRAGGWLMG